LRNGKGEGQEVKVRQLTGLLAENYPTQPGPSLKVKRKLQMKRENDLPGGNEGYKKGPG